MTLLHHIRPEDVKRLEDTFATPTDRGDGRMRWVIPDWLKLLRRTKANPTLPRMQRGRPG